MCPRLRRQIGQKKKRDGGGGGGFVFCTTLSPRRKLVGTHNNTKYMKQCFHVLVAAVSHSNRGYKFRQFGNIKGRTLGWIVVKFLDFTLANGLRVSQKARGKCSCFWFGWNSREKARWSDRISRSLAQKICWEWRVCKEGKLERHYFVLTLFLLFFFAFVLQA